MCLKESVVGVETPTVTKISGRPNPGIDAKPLPFADALDALADEEQKRLIILSPFPWAVQVINRIYGGSALTVTRSQQPGFEKKKKST